MSSVPALSAAPAGWPEVPEDVWASAWTAAHEAIESPRAVERLRRYYDPEDVFAGATFLEALPIDHAAITPTDLFAVRLLRVPSIKPREARKLIDPGPTASRLHKLLQLDRLPIDVDLAMADNDQLTRMSGFYLAVWENLGKNRWVTASKLCARKRPRLFPVRDEKVCQLLGLFDLRRAERGYQIDWQVYRGLMQSDELTRKLAEVATAARAAGHSHLDAYPLRWLDVLLWMHATHQETHVK